MRRHLILISTSVLMVAVISYFSVTLLKQNLLYFHGGRQDVEDFLKSFAKSHRPLDELNLSAMYSGPGQFQVLHPLFAMKTFSVNLPMQSCAQTQADGSSLKQLRCEDKGNDPLNPDDVDLMTQVKRHELQNILNGIPASENFILKPPFIDATGPSYAYLLSQTEIPPYNQTQWVSRHLSLFKPSELRSVLESFKITDPTFDKLARLNESEIQAMVEGVPLLMTTDYLLVKNESRLGFSPLSYFVYDLRVVRHTLSQLDYDLVPFSEGLFCLERVGQVCWTYNSKTALAYVYRYSLFILISFGLAFLILTLLYVRNLAGKVAAQKRHRTSLQVLSHEFRTPVTSLLLLMDELSKEVSTFSEANQDRVTKISAEAFRLQRIIEMSKTYLQSSSEAKRFQMVTLPSINTWIEDFARDLDPRIHCAFLDEDQSVKADPFWLKFVLCNLVQNAFAHGKEPVQLRIAKTKGQIQISVEDEGVCDFASLKEMTEAFVKSHHSQGMGLGLNITSEIVREWGGQMKFKPSPTSFSIVLNPKGEGPQLWPRS